MQKLKQHPLKYEQPDQFTFNSIKVPLVDGTRTMIHFKRMPQGEFDYDPQSNSLYTQINDFIQFKTKAIQSTSSTLMDEGDIPINRTIVIISFDHQIDEKVMMKVFSLNGKVRRIFRGQMKMKSTELNIDGNQEKAKKTYIGLVVYKNEYDLTKCFELDSFQDRIQKKFQALNKLDLEQGKQIYQQNLFNTYEKRDEAKDKYVQEAMDDGFEVVTDKFGDFDLNKPQEEFKSKAARKRKPTKKVELEQDQFKFQTDLKEMENALGSEPRAKSAKELMNSKKDQLKKAFNEDQQALLELKKKRKVDSI